MALDACYRHYLESVTSFCRLSKLIQKSKNIESMNNYTILCETFASALKQAGEETGMLLGQEFAISLIDALATSKASYFGDLDDAVFVFGVDSLGAYIGQFYLLFSLSDAIVLSGSLLGIPSARIQEKKRLAIIEADDIDAFSEVGNIINGAVNMLFQERFPNKFRLKVLQPKKIIQADQSIEGEPIPNGEYLMFRSRLEMTDQEMGYLDVLMPVSLADQFDPPPVLTGPKSGELGADVENNEIASLSERARSVSEEFLAADSPVGGEASEEKIDSIIVLHDDEDGRKAIVDAVAFSGLQVAEGTLDDNIKELFVGRNVRLVIIGSANANDRELSVCIKVMAMRQDFPPPIIMSAHRWTRVAALKALKYGARDILLTPCDDGELASKVRKFCDLPE